MIHGKKIVAVLPAYNAGRTLAQTVHDIPRPPVDEVILVDDASTDGTAALSRRLGLVTYVHTHNQGYGANQKTCYREALAAGADIVIMIHPDHQYPPQVVPEMVRPIAEGKTDAMFGSRMLLSGGARAGGMPWWKYAANIVLTACANLVTGTRLSEYHSGFRAYSSDVLRRLPLELNADGFVFDTEIILQMKVHGFRITEIPIPTRYFKDASTVGVVQGIHYGIGILRVLMRYLLHRSHLRHSRQFTT